MSTFEPFKFSYLHSVRDANFATLTLGAASTDAAHPLDYLRDNRSATYWKAAASVADGFFRWDRGAGTLPTLNRLIIPAGHNLEGRLRVLMDGASDYSSTTSCLEMTDADAGHQIDLPFTTDGTERYMQFDWQTAGIYEIPQLILTATFEPTTGFQPDNLVDEYVSNDVAFRQPSGAEARLALGPQQRRFEVEYHRLSGTELGSMEAFIANVGTSKPFWVDPPIFGVSAVLDQDLTSSTTGSITVSDGGDMTTGAAIYTIGDEIVVGAKVNDTTFSLVARGQVGSTAYAHESGERIVIHENVGGEVHRARWMKFEEMPRGIVRSVSLARGKVKNFRLQMIDHID